MIPMAYRLHLPTVVEFATIAHQGQVRKYSGEPYINHPLEVARIVSKCMGVTDEMIAAALLHDTVEDCDVTLEQITDHFGHEVARLVGWLTDVSRPEDGNRFVRKALDREHTGRGCCDAKTIKLADLISNTRSIVIDDPGFAKTYMAEKDLILHVIWQGNQQLFDCARSLVDEYIDTGTIDPNQFNQGGKHAFIL